MRRIVSCACLVVLAVAMIAGADGGTELRGTLHMRGATIVDPPPDESRNTHAAFLVRGAAAAALYAALPGPPVRDLCLDDGSLRKRAGNLTCVELAASAGYECDFAVNLATQAVEPGRVC